MRIAILRVHKDEKSYNQFWTSQERWDVSTVEGMLKVDIEGQIVHKARNMVVEQAISLPDWEVAVMVDDDMAFPPHTLVHALNDLRSHPDIDILCGVYFERRFPHTPQLYEEALEPSCAHKFWPILDYRERANSEGLLQVDACGTGFMFVRRHVFEAIRRPWFIFLDRLGEDFYFCQKARRCGFQIWADVALVAAHLSVILVDEQIFSRIRPHLKRLMPVLPSGVPEKIEFAVGEVDGHPDGRSAGTEAVGLAHAGAGGPRR